MLAKPKLQASLEPLKELQSFIQAATNANRETKSVPVHTDNADEYHAKKDRTQSLKFDENNHITEGLRTKSNPRSIAPNHSSSKKPDSVSPAAVQPVIPSTTSIADLAQSHDDLTK